MIRIAAAICLTGLCLAGSAAMSQPSEPQGFRGPPYQAQTPATLAGAQVVDAARAAVLHDAGVLFVDVYPRQKRPKGLPAGTIWRAAPHQTIPGAIWLYDTGYDRLSDAEERRLAAGLARELRYRDSPVVIFCRADCWMGWNAAKRAVELGYRNVNWFPGGTDDWMLQGRDLQEISVDAP